MNCKTCGEKMPDNTRTCPACGAENTPPPRRRVVAPSGEAAKRYHQQIEKGMRGETTELPRVTERQSRAERLNPPPIKQPEPEPAVRPRTGSKPPEKAQQAAAQQQRRSPSMPPQGQPKRPAPRKRAPARPLRRHQFKAIRPEPRGFESFHWVRALSILLITMTILTSGVYVIFKYTPMGQSMLASWGFDASADAYHQSGRDLMADGYIQRAVTALEIAQAKDTDNLEILVDLGNAYLGNAQPDQAELAFTRAIHFWPAYPEPYLRLANILLDKKKYPETVGVLEMAIENGGGEYFQTMLTNILPKTPVPSQLGKRYDAEIDITVTCADEGAVIHYSLDNEDPLVKGKVSTGNSVTLHLPKGSWRLRAVAEKDGMLSTELVQSYTIIFATPDMPTASLGPGTYSKVQRVTLKAAEGEKIYYTMDGTRPTPENSTLYEDGNPITLRTGKTVLRAIAVNPLDERSNELTREYVCQGNTGTSMLEKDVVDKLTLMKTTRDSFIKTYGEPTYIRPDGTDLLGSYEKLFYGFGYAVFLTRGEKDPVLAELYFNDNTFQAPRKTKVGSTLEEVLSAYRDDGGEPSKNGDRVLYKITTGKLGMLEKLADKQYKISYYTKLENGQHIELTYYTKDGTVEHIEWRQYASN